jgi:predicted DNA-binding protein
MLYTILETKERIGLGTTRIYEEISAGRLKAKKCGRRTFIAAEAIEEFIRNLEDYPVSKGA